MVIDVIGTAGSSFIINSIIINRSGSFIINSSIINSDRSSSFIIIVMLAIRQRAA